MEDTEPWYLTGFRELKIVLLEKEHIFSFHGCKGQSYLISDHNLVMSQLLRAAKVCFIIINHSVLYNLTNYNLWTISDLQNVNITLRILFRPKPDQLPKIYTILGIDYDDRVLPSITTEVLKAVVAQFDAGELITQREVILYWNNFFNIWPS